MRPARESTQYVDPPVIETVLGVEFDPLEDLRLLHLGLFWAKIRDQYPDYETKPEAAPVVDNYGSQPPSTSDEIKVQVIAEPRFKFWFKNRQEGLLQVQADRFIKNWRKVNAEVAYPKYPQLREEFAAEWGRYRAFLQEHGLGPVRVRQCEVTYVNQIVAGAGWQSLSDINRLLRLPAMIGAESLPPPASLAFQISYVDVEKARRVVLDVKHAYRKSDLAEVIQFNITVRGRPRPSEDPDILVWMDDARDLANKVFKDVTTDEARRMWAGGTK
jgi:uncharacterized protein (TIGR04255 family)